MSEDNSSPIPILKNDKIAEALAKAQGKFKQPELNRTAKVYKEGKLLYETHYADLNQCIECIRAPLSECGLSFTQTIGMRGNQWLLVLTLWHTSGQTIESFLPINAQAASQQIGSQLTYFKRYQLSAFFGLAADYDDDANGDAGAQAELSKKNKNQSGGGQQNQNASNKSQSKPPEQQSKPPANNAGKPGNAGASSPANNSGPKDAAPQESKDPADFIMPLGSEQVKGKRIGDLDEKTLRGIHAWCTTEMAKTPPVDNVAGLFTIATNVKAFMKQMGEEV